MSFASAAAMMALPILRRGSCEPFKAGIHGAALGLAMAMGLYNAAAWLHRRERHLMVNAVVYGMAFAFEKRHVAHHLNTCRDLAACRQALAAQDAAGTPLRAA